jgi:5,6-dimethylbenzimidazole synthase
VAASAPPPALNNLFRAIELPPVTRGLIMVDSTDASPHRFPDADVAAIYRVIAERRDMRHFRPDPVDPALLARLLWAAHHAPSVGYMQPWRFIRITDRGLRERMHALVEVERCATARALGEREEDFMRLKVEGLLEAGEVIVVALADGREKHVFGRRTLPEMDLASVACAIQNMWLAARAEGIGLGWVSIFDPAELADAAGHARRRPAGGHPVHRPRGGLLPPSDAGDPPVGRAHAPGDGSLRKRLARRGRRPRPGADRGRA